MHVCMSEYCIMTWIEITLCCTHDLDRKYMIPTMYLDHRWFPQSIGTRGTPSHRSATISPTATVSQFEVCHVNFLMLA